LHSLCISSTSLSTDPLVSVYIIQNTNFSLCELLCEGMEGTSSSSASSSKNFSSTAEDHHLVDDFYFSALHDDDEIFPISDEKYAEELQLQEALYSSTRSSARVEKEVVQVDSDDEADLPLRTLKRKEKETGETSHTYCGICMDAKSGEEMFRNQNCSHLYCGDCIGSHVAAKIQENISMVKCPEPKCKGAIEPENCRAIIPKEVLDRWENALCENVVLGSQKFYCPFKDCSAMMICDAEEVITISECPYCNRLFCAQCKVLWHAGLDCSEFKKHDERGREELQVLALAKNKSWRRCPKCKFYVEKTEGCQHISCRLVIVQSIILVQSFVFENVSFFFFLLGSLLSCSKKPVDFADVVRNFVMPVDPIGLNTMHVRSTTLGKDLLQAIEF